MTELLRSWKGAQIKQANFDFIAVGVEESSSAMCRQWSASPSLA
jgi:hypothetical protein